MRDLKDRIVRLLQQIGINIASKRIWIVSDNPTERYAKVRFATAEDCDLCYEALTNFIELYDVTNIVESGRRLGSRSGSRRR